MLLTVQALFWHRNSNVCTSSATDRIYIVAFGRLRMSGSTLTCRVLGLRKNTEILKSKRRTIIIVFF